MAGNQKVTKDITTPVGRLSWPHLSKAQAKANKNDDEQAIYDVQILIPKSDKAGIKSLLTAIKIVGEAKWGPQWTKVRSPLRDGDAEAGEFTEDGSTKGQKYPERLGHYFINARSRRPVMVVDRERTPILDDEVENEIYGGVYAKANLSFYPYSNSGNHGIGCGLNGVQKVKDGESFGGGPASVESMFDVLDEDEDEGLGLDIGSDDEDEKPAKKSKKSKKNKG